MLNMLYKVKMNSAKSARIVLLLSGMISYKTKQKEENLQNAQKGNN